MKDAVQIPVPSKDPEDTKKDQKPVHTDGAPKDDSKIPKDDDLVRFVSLHKRSSEARSLGGDLAFPPWQCSTCLPPVLYMLCSDVCCVC